MPESRKNKGRKVQQDQFKESKQTQKNSLLQDPNIRQFPLWNSDTKIEMFGREWEEIFNFINGVQGAYAACSSVMNRGVLDGTIKMRFEKLNANGQFVPMTPQEEKPYQEEFSQLIKQAKSIADQAIKQSKQQPEPPSQEGLPNLNDIVDANGNPVKSDEEQEGKSETPAMSIVRD